MRRVIASLVGLALLSAGCSGRSVAHSSSALTVRITDLPAGKAGAVVVSGPHSFQVRLTHTATLHVSPGRYRVKASGVPVGTDTYYPQHMVAQGLAPGTVVVDYAEQVPQTTKVLDAAALGLATGSNATDRELAFLPGGVGGKVQAGDVLVIPPGAHHAHTLFRKVLSVTVRSGEVLVAVTPAALRDAIPRGSFHERLAVDPSASLDLGRESCSGIQGGLAFTDSGSASVDGWVDFDFAWGYASPNYIKVVGGLSENVSASVTVTGAGYCVARADSPAIELPPFPFQLGPFPLEVSPELVAHAEVKGTLAISPKFGFTESGWAKAGFTWGTPDGSNQDLHRITGAGATFKFTAPEPSPEENLFAGIGPQLNFNIDGINGGPYTNILAGVTVDNTPLSPGRYHFEAATADRVNVGVRLKWGPLDVRIGQAFNVAREVVFKHDYSELTSTESPTPTSTESPVAATVVNKFEPWVAVGKAGAGAPAPGLVVTNGGAGVCDSGSNDDPGSAFAVRCSPPGNGTPCFINDTGGGDPGSPVLCSDDPTSNRVIEVTPGLNGIQTDRLNHADPNQPAWFLILADGRKCNFLGYSTNTNVVSYGCGGDIGATAPDRSKPSWTVQEGKIKPSSKLSTAPVAVLTAYR